MPLNKAKGILLKKVDKNSSKTKKFYRLGRTISLVP